MAAQESKESKVVLERTYTVPLRREFMKAQMYRRAKRAVKGLRSFLERHMKSENVKIGPHANRAIWKDGVKNPPARLQVHAVKYDSGEVYGELASAPAQQSSAAAKGKQQAAAQGAAQQQEAAEQESAAEEASQEEESSEEEPAAEETREEPSGEDPAEEEPAEESSGEDAVEETPAAEKPTEEEPSGEGSAEQSSEDQEKQ